MQVPRTRLLPLFLVFLPAAVSAQGPIGGFPTERGEVIVGLSYGYEAYEEYLGENGIPEPRDITTTSYALFLEAGLSDNTALVATLPYLRTNDRTGSLQDGNLWLKYNNLDKRATSGSHRLFTAVGLSFPVGNYETEGVAALGQRATVFQGRLVYQYQDDSGFFAHLQSGIDFQLAPESRSTWPLLLRSGYGNRYFFVEAWAEFITTLEAGAAVQTATAGSGSSWQRLGATLYVPVPGWDRLGVVVGGAWVTGGEFIGRSGRLNVGVVGRI